MVGGGAAAIAGGDDNLQVTYGSRVNARASTGLIAELIGGGDNAQVVYREAVRPLRWWSATGPLGSPVVEVDRPTRETSGTGAGRRARCSRLDSGRGPSLRSSGTRRRSVRRAGGRAARPHSET